jgi:hypothetical protein
MQPAWHGFWQYFLHNYLSVRELCQQVRLRHGSEKSLLRMSPPVCYSSPPAFAAQEKPNEIK